MDFVKGVFGQYQKLPGFEPADCVIATSFGTTTRRDGVNAMLRSMAVEVARNSDESLPLIMDEMLDRAWAASEATPHLIVKGEISTMDGRGTGTWGVLLEAKQFMDAHGLTSPILIAQACHVHRFAIQARRLGISPIVPWGMPMQFDRDSEQVWTRGLALWVPRELLGSLVLKMQGRL